MLRYDTERPATGLPPGEGAFLACSFWLVERYALVGRLDEAETLFERLLALPQRRRAARRRSTIRRASRMLGNFPQAFSHLALIVTAFNLAHTEKPAEQRSRDGH